MLTALVVALLLQAAPPDERFKLQFKQMPPEVSMDLVDTTVVEFEVPLRQDVVAQSKARGATLGEWLVTRGVCPDTDEACRFTVRFAGYVGTNAQTRKTEAYARYVVRSDAGKSAEGFSRAVAEDGSGRAYWLQKNGFWTFVGDTADQEREQRFYIMLLQLAKAGAAKAPPAPQRLSAPRISAPRIT